MKFNSLFLALAMTGGLFSGLSQAADPITGTTTLQAVFTANVLPGTCNAQVQYNSVNTETIDFGDLYKSDLGVRTEPFDIVLTECSGVLTTTVTAKPGAGNSCSGEAYGATGGTNTAVEIWQTAADTGTKLTCQNPASPAISHSFANRGPQDETNPDELKGYTFPMVARWVVANGKTADDVAIGAASSRITFSVNYQ
ncbi:fimbrial protein StaE [Superficieibacter electus]|uniref:Fimbrial protein StaE n=1 Tax=Superficieibacter electus TaxID=2022662 RepID=A0A2P5GMH5_9ENTR|nr:fimbrial protein StaE [Superficieibacter electus]POP41578.1 fimbrial protein StaE [Superficieibacter electus]POP47007.1 fimbrial protein StaE [Superficieibacter electus]